MPNTTSRLLACHAHKQKKYNKSKQNKTKQNNHMNITCALINQHFRQPDASELELVMHKHNVVHLAF
jgi:hypothetical protein